MNRVNNLLTQSPLSALTSNEADSNVTNYINSLKLIELKKCHIDPLDLSYMMDMDQTTIMQKLLGVRYAVLKHVPHYNSHPIAANLQGIAYQRCLDNAVKFGGRAIDVGGSVYRTPVQHHLCTKVSNAREDARYTTAINSKLGSSLETLNTQNRMTNCIHGAENCRYQAKYAYAVNVYDITMPKIAEIMDAHDIIVFDVWMFLPYALSDKRNGTDDDFYKCIVRDTTRNGVVTTIATFSLGDNSNVYEHDYDVWRDYLITTKIVGLTGSAIVVEHIETFGTFTNIRFTKTQATTGIIERMYPMSKYMEEFVMVPSVRRFLEDGGIWKSNKEPTAFTEGHKTKPRRWYDPFNRHDHTNIHKINGNVYEHYYVVEKGFVERAISHGNSLKKDAFTFEGLLAYCNAQRNSVFYEQSSHLVMVHRGLRATINVFRGLVMDLFLLISVQRKQRTQGIASAYSKIQDYDSISQSIRRFFTGFDKCIQNDDLSDVISETQVFSGLLGGLHVMYYQDIYYRNTVVVPSINIHIDSISLNLSVDPMTTPVVSSKCGIVDVPGDGFCGAHTLRHFGIIDHGAITEEAIAAGWYSEIDMISIANDQCHDVAVHHDGVHVYTTDNGFPVIGINFSHSHWSPTSCKCNESSLPYIGEYCDIVKRENYLYVNCANEQLTDAAGQALSFKKMFPGYSDDISKPVPSVTFKQFKGHHLAICVAHNNSHKPDIDKTIRTLHEICSSISNYATAHNLTVLMPQIGSSIYQNPLCCVKAAVTSMTCKKRLCFRNAQSAKQHASLLSCTHGGYKVYHTGSSKLQCNARASPSWSEIIPERMPDHQRHKFADLACCVDDMLGRVDASYFEVSCAPGTFVETGDNIVGAHYTPGAAMKRGVEPVFAYDSTKTFATAIHRVGKKDVVILDTSCSTKDFADAINCFQLAVVHCKPDIAILKITDDIVQSIDSILGNVHTTVIRNLGTNNVSSELFVFYKMNVTEHSKDVVDVSEIIAKVDHDELERQKYCSCSCAINFDGNATIVGKVLKQAIDMQIALLKDDKTISAATRERLCSLVTRDVDIELNANLGVGGAGKTMDITKSTCALCTILISPYRGSVKDINRNGNRYASTYVTAINKTSEKEYRNVIIDEVFAHNATTIAIHKLLSPASVYFATGDPKQLSRVDWDGTASSIEIKYHKPYRLVTHRNPQSIIDMFTAYIPGITTLCRAKNKVICKDVASIYEVSKTFNFSEAIIAFTHEGVKHIKDNLKSAEVDVITAAQSHSRTIEHVHLYMVDLKQLPAADRIQHFYTAASRCSRQLILYGEGGDNDIIAMTSGSAVERALLNTETVAIEGPVVVKNVRTSEIKGTDAIRIHLPPPCVDSVAATLAGIYVQYNNLDPAIVDIKSSYIPEIKSGKNFKTPLEAAIPQNIFTQGKRIHNLQNFNRSYTAADKVKALQTLAGRYAGRSQNQGLPRDHTKMFVKGIEKFLKPDWRDIAHKCRPDHQTIWKHCISALKSLQTKFPKEFRDMFEEHEYAFLELSPDDIATKVNTHSTDAINYDGSREIKMSPISRRALIVRRFLDLVLAPDATSNMYKDLEVEFNTEMEYHKTVSFHMKAQPKHMGKPNYDTLDKHGQGISAWTKMANLVCAAHVRYFDELLPFLIKPNVQLAYGQSDRDLSVFFLRYSNELQDKSVIKFMNDFSEFDCSQEKRGLEAIEFMYLSCGMNPISVAFMMTMRSKWRLSMRFNDKVYTAQAVLEGAYQQHSGQVHTLGSNTIYNMAAMGMCYDFGDYICASFKGDDSLVLCHRARIITQRNTPVYKRAGFKFKVETPLIAEFISNIVTPFGFVPDLLRRVTRVVSKIYTTKSDWEQIRKSTADCLAVLDERNLNVGLGWLRRHYLDNRIDVSISQLQDIYFYLKSVVHDPTVAPRDLEDIMYLDTNAI